MSRDRIFVVGDSHSTFWNGQDSFRSPAMAFAGVDLFYMGPLLAQNLHKPGDDFANQRTIDAIAQRAGSPGRSFLLWRDRLPRAFVQSAVQSAGR